MRKRSHLKSERGLRFYACCRPQPAIRRIRLTLIAISGSGRSRPEVERLFVPHKRQSISFPWVPGACFSLAAPLSSGPGGQRPGGRRFSEVAHIDSNGRS